LSAWLTMITLSFIAFSFPFGGYSIILGLDN
jgi:hypothetical protein